MTLRLKSRFSVSSTSKLRNFEVIIRFSHFNALGIRVGMTFRYSEVSRWGLGGSFLVSWMSFLVIQRSQGHFLGHLGAPKLDFTNLGCVLGPPWESLSRQVGDNFVILDVKIDVGIRKSFSK